VVESARREWDLQGHPRSLCGGFPKAAIVFAEADRPASNQMEYPCGAREQFIFAQTVVIFSRVKRLFVHEIFFRRTRKFGPWKTDGFKDIRDVAGIPGQEPMWRTRRKVDHLFNPHQKLVWETHLPFAPGLFRTWPVLIPQKQ